jgi:hypothetical protein
MIDERTAAAPNPRWRIDPAIWKIAEGDCDIALAASTLDPGQRVPIHVPARSLRP